LVNFFHNIALYSSKKIFKIRSKPCVTTHDKIPEMIENFSNDQKKRISLFSQLEKRRVFAYVKTPAF